MNKERIQSDSKHNEETYFDGIFTEFTAVLLPGDEHIPGRERKGRPPIPEWMKSKAADRKTDEQKS